MTGGSGGIGQAVAERLAGDGLHVVVHYATNPSAAQSVVERIGAAGGSASAFGGDVADEQDMSALFDHSESHYGGVDVVVNTAGILLLSPIAELDLDALDRIVRTNLRGTFVVTQQSARRVRRGGAIINFSTSVNKRSVPGYAAYSATKAAVDAITMIVAKELHGRDVTVNAVAPGPTATSMFLDSRDQEAIDALTKQPALERLAEPEDIAELVSFLAGPSRWVNGQVIYADGGLI